MGPARGQWNRGVQKRVSTTSSMLAQIKGLKMIGLTDYISKVVQGLRVAELELSKKFRIFIVRILLICTCINVSSTQFSSCNRINSQFLRSNDTGGYRAGCCLLDPSRARRVHGLGGIYIFVNRGAGSNACCKSHGIVPYIHVLSRLFRPHPTIPTL